jgi:hypothetical protein
MAAARAKGELVEFSDIVKKFTETAAKMPEPATTARIRELRQRDVNLEVPTITLTEKQIEARKQREREEIEREKQIS